jgi:hypothetical protein
VNALSRSGRFRVIVMTPSASSVVICSKSMTHAPR